MLSKTSPSDIMAATSNLPFRANPPHPAYYSVPPCQKHASSQQKMKVIKSVSKLHLIHWKRWLCLSTLPFVFWIHRSYFFLREIPLLLTSWILKDFSVYLSFVMCLHCSTSDGLIQDMSISCFSPIWAFCLLQMLPIVFQMCFFYNILGCGECLQKAVNTWQCDQFIVKFNFSS